ncbi:hypothetical protein ASPCAL14536 [Aspergillus calidoustus]|uniref:Uncharacterized protein n=1 Tax=Aspergillus calidoustus TaxID=454130 RepID=A0A0U5CK42_ASPCI|nr:hypothetical protein ASPCAL14536 [Aspergillus calidoustus]
MTISFSGPGVALTSSFSSTFASISTPATLLPSQPPKTNPPCSIFPNITHTFYGISANEDQGPNIAYNCGNRSRIPGGLGTYVNPVTFASAPGMFQRCEIIYDPYLQKYLRHEDYCSDCDDWDASCVVRIKVWIGTGWLRGDVNEELECQRRLMVPGRLDSVIRSPRRDLEDDSTPLYVPGFDTPSICNVDHVYPAYTPEDYC